MSSVAASLPSKKILTRHEIKEIFRLTNRQADSKIDYYQKKGLLEKIRKGVFLNTQFSRFDEREKIQLATSLFPTGYVTAYEALRYWSVMSLKYEGICLRVDWWIDVAVPKVISRPVKWKGYQIKSFQMKKQLIFGIQETLYGKVAEPEKAVLDIFYMGLQPDNIEFHQLDQDKLQKYAQPFPLRITKKICH